MGLRRYFQVQSASHSGYELKSVVSKYVAMAELPVLNCYQIGTVFSWCWMYYKVSFSISGFKKKCLFSVEETVAFHRLSCPDGKNRLSLNFGGLVNWMVLLKVLKCKQTFFFCCWVQCYSVWKPSEYVLSPCSFQCFMFVLFFPHPCTGTFWTVQGVCTFVFVLLLYLFSCVELMSHI